MFGHSAKSLRLLISFVVAVKILNGSESRGQNQFASITAVDHSGLKLPQVSDLVDGAVSSDLVDGAVSSDLVDGAVSSDLVDGAVSSDEVDGAVSSDLVDGAVSSDEVDGAVSSDLVDGAVSSDLVDGAVSSDEVDGAVSSDLVDGAVSSDEVDGAVSSDEVDGAVSSDEVDGAVSSDEVDGAVSSDEVDGAVSSDLVDGAVSSDLVDGAVSSDEVDGAVSSDEVDGAVSSDEVDGAVSSDEVDGAVSSDLVDGAVSSDLVDGAVSSDLVDGAVSSDLVDGAVSSDLVDGAVSSDLVDGAVSSDLVDGAVSSDEVDGAVSSDLTPEISSWGFNAVRVFSVLTGKLFGIDLGPIFDQIMLVRLISDRRVASVKGFSRVLLPLYTALQRADLVELLLDRTQMLQSVEPEKARALLGKAVAKEIYHLVLGAVYSIGFWVTLVLFIHSFVGFNHFHFPAEFPWIRRHLGRLWSSLFLIFKRIRQESSFGSQKLKNQLSLDAACFAGDEKRVQELLKAEEPAMLEVLPEGAIDGFLKRSPFEAAVDGGRLHIVQTLVDQGLSLTNAHLGYAVGSGNTEIVKWVLEKGSGLDIKTLDFHKYLFQHPAAPLGAEVLQLLVDNGVDVRGDFLRLAIHWVRKESVKTLLDFGVDPDSGNSLHKALWYCSMGPSFSRLYGDEDCAAHLSVASLLVERGADVIRVFERQSAFDAAVNLIGEDINISAVLGLIDAMVVRVPSVAFLNEKMLLLEERLKKAADFFSYDKIQEVQGLIMSRLASLESALEAQASLESACFLGNMSDVQALLEAGAKVEVPAGLVSDPAQRSPFEAAVDGGNLLVVQALRERGLNLNKSHLDYVVKMGNTEIMKWILGTVDDIDPKELAYDRPRRTERHLGGSSGKWRRC